MCKNHTHTNRISSAIESQLAAGDGAGAGKAAAIAKVSAIGCNRFLLSAQIMAIRKHFVRVYVNIAK